MHRIDPYGFGRVVVDGIAYTSDVIAYPDRVDASWRRREGHELHPDDLREVLKAAPRKLIVGPGESSCMKVLPETERLLKERGVRLEAAGTDEACRLYNACPGGAVLGGP